MPLLIYHVIVQRDFAVFRHEKFLYEVIDVFEILWLVDDNGLCLFEGGHSFSGFVVIFVIFVVVVDNEAGLLESLISVVRPVEEGRQISEILECHLVVQKRLVPPFFHRNRYLSQSSLKLDDVFRLENGVLSCELQ